VRAGVAGLRPALAEARAARPDLVVVLAHEAAACQAASCDAPATALARDLQDDGVDVVVAGGAGGDAAQRVGRTWVVRPRGAGAEVAVIDLVRTAVGARELRVRREPVDAEALPADSSMDALVARAAAAADSVAARPVARLKVPIGRADGALAALVADAARNALRADVALVDPGALAADLPAGSVAWGAVRAVFRAPAALVRLRLSGSDLRHALVAGLRGGAQPLAVSGLTVRWSSGGRSGPSVERVRLVNGRDLRDGTTYIVAVTRALAGSPGLLPTAPAELSGTRDLDALAAYLRLLPQPVAPAGLARYEEVRR
jgi:2',3'-cyclic-nucleotide 2'-phosphodiesterase (5'-nucleotidase family)